MRRSVISGLIGLGVVTGVGLLAIPASTALGQARADEQPPLEEDFSYPGAKNIPDIELIKGDGHITMVECTNDPALITVESIGRTVYCFRVDGDTGWLSLRLDRVFLVGSGDQEVAATITANGTEETVVVPEGQVRPTGATDPNFAVLLELRASA
jgi:hypothetical protein